MKKQLAILLLLSFASFKMNAQDNWSKKRISPNLVENYMVSTVDKRLKQGEYFVVNDNHQELVRGSLKRAKRTVSGPSSAHRGTLYRSMTIVPGSLSLMRRMKIQSSVSVM